MPIIAAFGKIEKEEILPRCFDMLCAKTTSNPFGVMLSLSRHDLGFQVKGFMLRQAQHDAEMRSKKSKFEVVLSIANGF